VPNECALHRRRRRRLFSATAASLPSDTAADILMVMYIIIQQRPRRWRTINYLERKKNVKTTTTAITVAGTTIFTFIVYQTITAAPLQLCRRKIIYSNPHTQTLI